VAARGMGVTYIPISECVKTVTQCGLIPWFLSCKVGCVGVGIATPHWLDERAAV